MDKPIQIKNMPRYKVIFIGDQAVGKTSIVSRFVYESFSIAHQVFCFYILANYRHRFHIQSGFHKRLNDTITTMGHCRLRTI